MNPLQRILYEQQLQEEEKVTAVTQASVEKDTNPQLRNQKKMLLLPRCSMVEANAQYISRLVMKGFTPKWYVVFHLNNYRDSPDSLEVKKDDEKCKQVILQAAYGYHWKKKPIRGDHRRGRMVISKEYGKKKDRPHFNILLEDLAYPFNTQQSLEVLFNFVLPDRARCVWRKSADIQPIHYPTKDKLIRYICKESNWKNTTLDYQLSDLDI